jgi:ceramide glucosyltransferase
MVGTWIALKRCKARPAIKRDDELPPVSILKPLKGVEPGMEANLHSFFHLDYPNYELLFSIADVSDPARPLVTKLIARHPEVPARLIIGDVDLGPNPKINNLFHSYREATHDLLLISDSTVRVSPQYLRKVVNHLGPEVGAVTAVVAGIDGGGLGGHLEAVFLNSFYARWMHVATSIGCPFIVGKSMLFRRSTAERFGGLANLGRYIAEDYMAGKAIQKLGLKIELMNEPIRQHIGTYAFRAFWSRHIRWGRIRKSQAPIAFLVEPLLGAMVSGALGAWAFWSWVGADPIAFFASHMLLWFGLDVLVMRQQDDHFDVRAVLAWVLRESLAFPLWLHIATGSSVMWRGKRLRILPGGLVTSGEL